MISWFEGAKGYTAQAVIEEAVVSPFNSGLALVGECDRELLSVARLALRLFLLLVDGGNWLDVVPAELTSLCVGVEGRSSISLKLIQREYFLIREYKLQASELDK